MNTTSVAAINRIISGKSNPYKKNGAWFQCNETGKFGVTDSYCCVLYDNDFDVSIDDMEYQPISLNASKLFASFNNEFEMYSNNHMDDVSVEEVVFMYQECNKYRKKNSMWYCLKRYGVYYSIKLLRDVCEALSSNSVKIYYPVTYTGIKSDKPIVIVGENGMGLIMPIGN